MKAYVTGAVSALSMIVATSAVADPTAEVLHYWTSGGEAKSVAVLQKEFADKDKKFKDESNALKKEETQLIAKKKSFSSEEYKKKVSALRKKNIDFQQRRKNASNEFIKKRNDARNKLLEALDPVLEKYMDENNVSMIINENNIILANSTRDLTKKIIDLLDKELKSIKLN